MPRRSLLQVGGLSLLGLSASSLSSLGADELDSEKKSSSKRSVIYIFLSGGLSQHESFDLKPEAPDSIRGDFSPIATATRGTLICEHLPLLAQRSRKWSLVRSLTHTRNDHGQGIHIMNTGRANLPPGLNRNKPQRTDFPSMLSVAGSQLNGPRGLPATAVLPRLVENVNRLQRPGQTAGLMGAAYDPWLIKAAAECDGYGACPACLYFSNKPKFTHSAQPVFQAPNLNLPEGLSLSRLDRRTDLLREVEQ